MYYVLLRICTRTHPAAGAYARVYGFGTLLSKNSCNFQRFHKFHNRVGMLVSILPIPSIFPSLCRPMKGATPPTSTIGMPREKHTALGMVPIQNFLIFFQRFRPRLARWYLAYIAGGRNGFLSGFIPHQSEFDSRTLRPK